MRNWSERLAAAVIGLICVTVGCSEAQEEPPPPLLELGDPCRTTLRYCIDEQTVQLCEDDVWTVKTCDEACAELGPAYVADACVDDDCSCALADPDGCVPGQTSCTADNSVSVCSDAQSWESVACDELCAESGLLSRGCIAGIDDVAGCWCTSEGTPCDSTAPPVCADSVSLARCEDGLWSFEDCAASCASPSEGQCIAWATPAYCACS